MKEYSEAKDVILNYHKAREIIEDIIKPEDFYDYYSDEAVDEINNIIYNINKDIKNKIRVVIYLKSLKRSLSEDNV